MNITYLIYETASGRILSREGRQAADLFEGLEVGQEVFFGSADDVTNYIDLATNTIQTKPDMGCLISATGVLANSTAQAVISNVPAGAEAFMNYTSIGVVNDGTLELTFDEPGTHTVRLELFPYLDTEFTINAV